MQLLVDVEAGRVQLGQAVFAGQWVDFYALLALSLVGPDHPVTHVTVDAVARVGPWRHKTPASVGKEVARHLRQLSLQGLDGIVSFQGRTRAWRLALMSEQISFHPSRDSVRAWIEKRSTRTAEGDGWLDELRALVGATAMLQRGYAEAALQRLDERPRGASRHEPALEAWSALLHGRALHLHDDDDERLHRLYDEWSKRVDAPGRAVSVRLRSWLSLRHRFEDPATTLASLGKVAADLELRGDIGSLGVVENVMGLLARRAGSPEAGAVHHLRAVALFGISGDYPSLQAPLYNLALCRREALQRDRLPPDESVLDLVELCRLVCDRFGVGKDSAQAEISGAEWAFEMGDLARARMYLAAAEEMLETIDSTYDHACFLEARARVDSALTSGKGDAPRDLRAALARYRQVGDWTSVARVRRMLERAGG